MFKKHQNMQLNNDPLMTSHSTTSEQLQLSRKIAHNTAIQIAGKVLSTILGLLSVGLLTRYLGQSGFGEYTTIMAFLQFTGIFADFGLSLVTVQMISREEQRESHIINNIITLRIVTAAAIFTLAPVLALIFPYSSTIKIGIAITAVSFVSSALNQVITGIFQKRLAMNVVVLAENLGRLVLLVLVGVAVTFRLGLFFILGAVVLSTCINLFINFLFIRRWLTIRFSFDFSMWKTIWTRTWPIALSIFFVLIYFKADTIILSLTQSQADTGIYGATYKVLEVFTTLPYLFLGLLLPLFTIHWSKGDKASFFKVAQDAFNVMVLLSLPVIIGSYLLGEPIMRFIAGDAFAASGRVLQILGIAIMCIFLSNAFTHIIVAIDRQKVMMWGFMFVAILALTGYLIFIPQYSYLAAAWITVISEALILFISMAVVFRYTRFFPKFKTFFQSVVASIIMGGVIWLLSQFHFHVIFIIAVSGIVYFTGIILMGGIQRDTLVALLSLKNKVR